MADFIQGLQTPAVIFYDVFVHHPSSIPICLVEKTFTTIGIRGNFINTLWIAIDRYFYIVYPLRYPLWMTNAKWFTIISLTWLYLVIETPLLVYFENVLEQGGTCAVSTILSSRVYDGYLVPQVGVCMLVTILCYIAIAITAHKQSMAIAALQQPFETLESSIFQRQKKIAKMMFMVLASYLLCYIPVIAASVIIQSRTSLVSLAMQKVSAIIFFTNSFINPIIYAWRSKEFNKVFKKVLGIKTNVAPTYGNPT